MNDPRGNHFFTRQERVGEPGAEPDYVLFPCIHARPTRQVTVNVLDTEIDVTIPEGVPLCRTCFETFLNVYATTCGYCGKPILPGDMVAEVPDGTRSLLPRSPAPPLPFLRRLTQPIFEIARMLWPGRFREEAEGASRPPPKYKLVHRTVACASYLDRFCGHWGQGRLISLHELLPDVVPPGTRTMTGLNFALNGDEQPIFIGFGDK